MYQESKGKCFIYLLMTRSWIMIKLFACMLCITTLVVAIAVVHNPHAQLSICSDSENEAGPVSLYSGRRAGKRQVRLVTAFDTKAKPIPDDGLLTEEEGSLRKFKSNSNCNQSGSTDMKSAKTTVPCMRELSLGHVTNDPFREPTIQVSTFPTDTKPVSCPDKLCFNFAVADKKRNSCWKTGKKSIAGLGPKDFRCHFINGTGRLPVGLISFPGSGNTWVRGLLEQVTGVCTGSIYCDIGLLEKGFVGENIRNGAVLVVKSHAISPPKENVTLNLRQVHFSGIIFIIRNVFDALESEMNRQVYNRHHMSFQSWKSHVFTAGKLRFGQYVIPPRHNKVWTKFVHSKAQQWLAMIKNWIASNRGQPVLVIRYEDVTLSPMREVKKMLRFLNVEYNATIVEERLQQDFNIYRRHKKQKRNVYSKELQAYVNSVLSDAEKLIHDSGLQDVLKISDYHR